MGKPKLNVCLPPLPSTPAGWPTFSKAPIGPRMPVGGGGQSSERRDDLTFAASGLVSSRPWAL